MSKELAASWQLSAEQIEMHRRRLNDLQSIGVIFPPGSDVLCDMALSSLRGTLEVDSLRQEVRDRDTSISQWERANKLLVTEAKESRAKGVAAGIEAAAKKFDTFNPSVAAEIRALAQGQRSEQSSGLNGDVSSVSPSSSSSAPNGVERTGNSASIDTVTGRRDGHPSEQCADNLLREVLDWGLPDDLKQRIDAHLSRKESK